MNKRCLQQVWHLENLENRQLLSVSVPPTASLLDAGMVVAQPMVKTPNIVATWKGMFSRPGVTGTVIMKFTSQTASGALSGTVTTKDSSGTWTYPFTGKITGDSIKFTTYDGDDTTFKGIASGKHANVITGTATNDNGAKSRGSVTRTK